VRTVGSWIDLSLPDSKDGLSADCGALWFASLSHVAAGDSEAHRGRTRAASLSRFDAGVHRRFIDKYRRRSIAAS